MKSSSDDTAHALRPRNVREALALAKLHEDSVSPLVKAYGGIEILWTLDLLHPFNVAGDFAWHDAEYDLIEGGLLRDPWYAVTDSNLLKRMKITARRDLSSLPYSLEGLEYARERFTPARLDRHADVFYGICRGWAMFRYSQMIIEGRAD